MSPSDDTLRRVRDLAERLAPQQVKWRRRLHQQPELAYEEVRTTHFLRKHLEKWGLTILPLSKPTGVLADIDLGRPGPTVAVRSDIDALPITEQSGVSFASRNAGCMHACGHDVHMATVLGVARVLSQMKNLPGGKVRLLFQPAEERPPGGAIDLIADGALDGVKMIFGLHVDPTLKCGAIGLRDGVTMASVTDFDLIIRGRAGHGARPQDGVDAIATACEVVESLQKIISREIDPISPVAITIGKIEGGVARNCIADEVRLYGTARSLSKQASRLLPRLIKRTAQGVCRARGAKVEMTILGDYPVFVNDPKTNRYLHDAYKALYPKGTIAPTEQVLGGEDFARYLEKVPGAMFRLGTRNQKMKADQPWHSPRFRVDEAAMPVGTALICAAVIARLEAGG